MQLHTVERSAENVKHFLLLEIITFYCIFRKTKLGNFLYISVALKFVEVSKIHDAHFYWRNIFVVILRLDVSFSIEK